MKLTREQYKVLSNAITIALALAQVEHDECIDSELIRNLREQRLADIQKAYNLVHEVK